MLPSCKTLESWEILGKKFVLSHIFFPPKHYPAHQERQPGPTLLRRQFYEATFLNAHSGGTVFCGLGTVLRWELHRNCVKFPHMNKYNLSSLQGSLAFFFLGEICGFLRSHRFTISSGKFPSDFLIEKSSEFWTWFFPATCYFSLGGGYQKTYFSASACSQNCFLKSPKLFLEKNCSRMPKIKFVFVYSFACSFAFFLHCFFSYRAFSRVHVSSPVVCAFPPLPPPPQMEYGIYQRLCERRLQEYHQERERWRQRNEALLESVSPSFPGRSLGLLGGKWNGMSSEKFEYNIIFWDSQPFFFSNSVLHCDLLSPPQKKRTPMFILGSQSRVG